MDSEKNRQDDQRRCMITALILGFIVVTAALVVMTVLGGLYLTRLQNNNGKQEIVQPLHLQSRYTRAERDVLDDREQQVELIKNKEQNGRVVSLVSLHYQQNLISMHVPEKNLCFLIGGIMKEAGSFDDDVPFRVTLVSPGQTISKTEGTHMDYTMNSDNQVSSSHIHLYTKVLSPYCTNTNTYWLERKVTTNVTTPSTTGDITTQATNGRKKRNVCIFCGVNVNVDCCSLF